MRLTLALVLVMTAGAAAGCDGDDLDSDAEARRAYLGFDRAVDRGLALGLRGFNAASSANIPPQEGSGDDSGTMTVSGQVDQGSSDNKGMRLDLVLVDYDDGPFEDSDDGDETLVSITYDTTDALPRLDLSLRDIPNGTFTGSLDGTLVLRGDVEAEADFALVLSGGIIEDPLVSGGVMREPGTLTITGTVAAGDGLYDVDVRR